MHDQLGRIDLDLTRREILVHHLARTSDDHARDADDGLAFQLGRLGAQIRVELHLRDTLAVAKVDKDDAAVVTDGIHPAGQRDRRVEVRLGELGAMVRAFHRDRGSN